MNKISAGLLIVGTVLAMNAAGLRDTFAADMTMYAQPSRMTEVRETVETRSSRVLALVVALRALSSTPAAVAAKG